MAELAKLISQFGRGKFKRKENEKETGKQFGSDVGGPVNMHVHEPLGVSFKKRKTQKLGEAKETIGFPLLFQTIKCL